MGGYSQLKASVNLDYNLTDTVTLAYNAQYIQGMDGDNYGDKYTTDDVIYHNISAAYEVNDQWRINGGVKNLLNTDPEYVPDGNDMNTIPSLYDVVGRTFYVSTRYRF